MTDPAPALRNPGSIVRDFAARARGPAVVGIQVSLALVAIVSLQPYFMWGYQRVYYAVVTGVLIVCCALGRPAFAITRERVALAVGFSLFMVYLSLLPKLGGGVTRWFFLIPSVAALLLVSRENLAASFDKFQWIFAVTLLPGMVCWLWLAAALPVELTFISPPGNLVQREETPYFAGPGFVFLPYNGMLLPNGGTIFRLCGIHDEPGTVGTISALCLAASRFRISNFRGAVCLVAGLMSLSIAFAVIAAIGFVATAVSSKRLGLLVPAVIATLVGCVPLLGLQFDIKDIQRRTTISIVLPPTQISSAAATTPGRGQPFGLWDGVRLRQSPTFNNRIESNMHALLKQYLESGAATLAFGIASNASNVHAGHSAHWTQVLTNYGAVGFAWLFVLFAAPLVLIWRRGHWTDATFIFVLLFLMSFYQRPVIWLPAQMLLYFAGLYYRDHPGDEGNTSPDASR
jgi:hypothetical protein